jgi:molybdopterin/thiamine biosynthesis adenylyltransferase
MDGVVRIEDSLGDSQDRFARFRLINWWDQARLREAKILVVGAGALGNEILKNLALLGVGRVLVADKDVIENSNLSRSCLFRESDNGALKAEVAAKAVRTIFPEVRAHWFQGDVVDGLGLGAYRWADLVIAGLDNRRARLGVNRACWKANRPWIDGAIEQLDGLVRVFVPPHGSCYECTMSKTDWDILNVERSCNLLTRDEMLLGKVPTTPTSASVVAAIQCQEAVKLLHGLEVLDSKAFVFRGLSHDSYVVSYPRKADCFSHVTYDPVEKLGSSVRRTKVRDLLREVKARLGHDAVLEFNQEIVGSLECAGCGRTEAVFRPLGRVSEKEARCPHCGEERNPTLLHGVCGDEPFLERTFSEIGIPPFDIIAARKGLEQIYLEFDGDAPEVLGPLGTDD